MTGLHTNMGVRHTLADAYFRGYRLMVPTDGTEAFTEKDYQMGLDYLKQLNNIYVFFHECLDRVVALTTFLDVSNK